LSKMSRIITMEMPTSARVLQAGGASTFGN
jgi:hypothetical protein